MSNSLDPDQARHVIGSTLVPNCLQKLSAEDTSTVKPVLSCHLKFDKTKVLMTNGSLMKVKSIAECSKVLQNAPRGAFCNNFDLH